MHYDFLIDLNDDLGTDSASSILTKEGSYRKSSIEHLYLFIHLISSNKQADFLIKMLTRAYIVP